MKTILEDNFLGYRLEINIDPANRDVLGTLFDKANNAGKASYVALANCAPEDKFSEVKGIKLVKLKLARQVHNDKLVALRECIKDTEDSVNALKAEANFHLYKIVGIDAVLRREFERTVYAKTGTKKTTTRKTSSKKTSSKKTTSKKTTTTKKTTKKKDNKEK